MKKDRERERDGECELWAKKERGGHKNEIPDSSRWGLPN